MTLQIEELEPTVSKIYSPQNAVKDNEIKDYLIYLLRLKDNFEREVQTKKEIIQQREDQIKKLVVKLCAMRNEYSKKKREVRAKSSEFTQLENMSNKMNELEQRVCSLKNEMKKQRKSIMAMRVFQKQYKNFENKFRSQITRMAEDVQRHLDSAVATYEQREEFIHKAKIYKDRCAQDLRKAGLNENNLQLVLDETEKLEDFESIQKQKRFDSRLATTGDLIDHGLTGLEPDLDWAKHLNSAIFRSSGKEEAYLIEDHYKLTDEHSKSMFSYLEQLLKDVEHLQDTIGALKDDSRKTQKCLEVQERRLKWEIGVEKKLADKLEQEAATSEASLGDARGQFRSLLEKLQSVHKRISLDAEEERDAGEQKEISESNAIDFKDAVERKILRLLVVVEYLRVQQDLKLEENESTASIFVGSEEEEENQQIVKIPEVEYLDTLKPRLFKTKSDVNSCLGPDDTFLDADKLNERAEMAVTEIEKEVMNKSEI